MSDENTPFEDDNQQHESQIEVAESAPVYVNGNGSATHTPEAKPQGLMADVKIKVPASQFLGRNYNNLMGAVNTRKPFAKEPERVGSDRQFIDELMFKPESSDFQFSISRYLPAHFEGEPVRNGKLDSMQIMPYDSLVEEIERKWGGGMYRLIVIDNHNRTVDSIARTVLINIATTRVPPANEAYANEARSRVPSSPADAVVDDDEKEKERLRRAEQKERDWERKRQADELRKLEEDTKIEERRAAIENRRAALNGGNRDSELKALLAKIESDRIKVEQERKDELRRLEDQRKEEIRRAEEERKEERRRQDEQFKLMLEQQREDRKLMMEAMAKPKEDTGFKDMIQLMLSQQAQQATQAAQAQQSTTAILTALISKEPPKQPPPPDNMPLIAALNESNSRVVTALLQRPQEDRGEKMLDAMVKITAMTKKDDSLQNQLIQGLLAKKDDGVGIEEMMALIKLGEDRSDKMFSRIQEITGAITPQGEGEVQEDGYDPKLGFLGNAGKSLFSGLKSVVEMAATNPQVQELLVKMVGSRTPSQQDLALAAMRMENQFVSPPTLMAPPMPMQQHQQPQFRGPYSQPLPPPLMPQDVVKYNEMTQRQQAQPQQYAVPPQQHLNTRQPGDPNRIDVIQPVPMQQPADSGRRPAPPPQTEQQAVANEMEGAASGVSLPSNGDPEPDALPSNEEIARQAQIEAVTRTMELALQEMITKPVERTWAEEANATWPKALKDQVAAAPTMPEKVKLLMDCCEEAVWLRLAQKLEEESKTADRGKEEMIFAGQLLHLTNLNKPGVAPHA